MIEILYVTGERVRHPGKMTLGEAQGVVGGPIEVVRLPDMRQMLVNEEARVQRVRPPVNAAAGALYGSEILGNAVIMDSLRELT